MITVASSAHTGRATGLPDGPIVVLHGLTVNTALTVSIGCWLLAASTAWTGAPVKLMHWQLKSSLFTGSVKTPILFLLCAVNNNICAALPLVTEEQKRTQVERDAFNTFTKRVQAMDTDHHSVSHP